MTHPSAQDLSHKPRGGAAALRAPLTRAQARTETPTFPILEPLPTFPRSADSPPPAAPGPDPVTWHPRSPRTTPSPIQLETTGLSSHPATTPAGATRRPRQLESRIALEALKETVVARLRATHRPDLADPLAECSTRWTIRECQGCRSTVSFLNHCDRFYCPMCQPRLAKLRRQAIEWWAHTIPQPKHVVLTTRNTETITAAHLAAIKNAFARLRRSKFAANWRGGCWALEVTNEGRGWHLHIHALVDAKWIDAGQLAREWAKRVGQDFAIVKVRDCRGTEFLKEVTKYTVKGNDLANWSGSDLAAFVDAFAAGRNFGTFGTLYRRNAEWRQWLAAAEANYTACPCGCTDFRYFTPDEWEWEMIRRETGPPARVPAPINPQLLFAGLP